MTPPPRLVVLLLVVALGACGGEAPSAPDAGADALADALPPPPPDAAPLDASDAAPDAAPSWCPAPGMVCAGGCVDTSRDPAHCGVCDRGCLNGTACVAGLCVAPRPDASAPDVAADRAEQVDAAADAVTCDADTSADRFNCGACGVVCPASSGEGGGAPACRGGRCALVCSQRWGDCDGDLANGCETRTDTSARHCGACGNECMGRNVCSAGRCAPKCAPGYATCDDGRGGRSCANTGFDRLNCGACGNVCPAGQVCDMYRCR